MCVLFLSGIAQIIKRMQTVGEYKLCYGLNSNWTASNHPARLVRTC